MRLKEEAKSRGERPYFKARMRRLGESDRVSEKGTRPHDLD